MPPLPKKRISAKRPFPTFWPGVKPPESADDVGLAGFMRNFQGTHEARLEKTSSRGQPDTDQCSLIAVARPQRPERPESRQKLLCTLRLSTSPPPATCVLRATLPRAEITSLSLPIFFPSRTQPATRARNQQKA